MVSIIINILGLSAILNAILVITRKNPVISILYLIIVFLNISGYLVLIGINFIGISYIIIYIGAIIVLFLFVIMILNLQFTELNIIYSTNKNIPLGIILRSIFIYEIISIISFIDNNYNNNSINTWNQHLVSIINPVNYINSIYLNITSNIRVDRNIYINTNINTRNISRDFSNFIQIQSLSNSIYTNNSIWLIITSIILLLAIVRPITLTGQEKPSNGS
jgi:NADH-ubiquinone oxidoreductase chain 6